MSATILVRPFSAYRGPASPHAHFKPSTASRVLATSAIALGVGMPFYPAYRVSRRQAATAGAEETRSRDGFTRAYPSFGPYFHLY